MSMQAIAYAHQLTSDGMVKPHLVRALTDGKTVTISLETIQAFLDAHADDNALPFIAKDPE